MTMKKRTIVTENIYVKVIFTGTHENIGQKDDDGDNRMLEDT